MRILNTKGDNLNHQDTLTLIPKSAFDTIPIDLSLRDSTLRQNHDRITGDSIKHNVHSYDTRKIIANSPSNKNDSIDHPPIFLKVNTNFTPFLFNYKEIIWFNSTSDKTCYIVKKQKDNDENVYVLSDGIKRYQTTNQNLVVNPKISINDDWVLIPLLLGLVILASVLAIYRKYLGQIVESTIYHFASSKHLNEKNSPFQRLTIILDFLFIISFSLLADQVIRKFSLFSAPLGFDYLIFLLFFCFLLLLRVARWIFYKFSAIISNQEIFFRELFSNSTLYTRTLGVFLLPMVFFITYSTGLITILLIYLSITAAAIVLIIRIIRLFKVFVVSGFSIFYFILYLCALEIIPLLFIWKEFNSR